MGILINSVFILVLFACGFIKRDPERDSEVKEQDRCWIKQPLTTHCCLSADMQYAYWQLPIKTIKNVTRQVTFLITGAEIKLKLVELLK